MERLQRDEGLLDHEHIVRPKFSDRFSSMSHLQDFTYVFIRREFVSAAAMILY